MTILYKFSRGFASTINESNFSFLGLLTVAFASIDENAHTANTFEESSNTPESDFLDITQSETSERSSKAEKFETSSIRIGLKKIRPTEPPTGLRSSIGSRTKPTKKIQATEPPTPAPEVDTSEYIQCKNKFDEFDWLLSQVCVILRFPRKVITLQRNQIF